MRKVIYRRDFWDRVAITSPALRYQSFDFAVNSGIDTAVRKLQQVWGVADDGVWGPVSAAALARAPHRIQGSLESGAQEHLYLEGQAAYALPQEQGQWLVHASTQHPGEVQHAIASALGLRDHDVQVVCRRMGGGFGGKETQASQIAIWATLAAHKFARPVKLRLDRDDDFLITGKRHAFSFDWEAGFDDQGRLLALELTELADCGFSADLSVPICDRAVFHSDNAYFLEHVAIHSWRCRTHKQSSTAFRGFGGPQGMLVIETVMGEIARRLGLRYFVQFDDDYTNFHYRTPGRAGRFGRPKFSRSSSTGGSRLAGTTMLRSTRLPLPSCCCGTARCASASPAPGTLPKPACRTCGR